MSLGDDDWLPITDLDLLEDLAPVAPIPSVEPVVCEPTPRSDDAKSWPKRPRPTYSAEDWRIFHLWVHDLDHSIDEAAACAGIDVYDALVALEKRDPWFYQYKVLDGPRPNRSTVESRRRRGIHMNMGGAGKNYTREEPQRTPTEPTDGKLLAEEAQRRFLALLGGRNENERVDGRPEPVRQFRRGVFVPGVSDQPKRKRTVKFKRRKCGHCRKQGHNQQTCPDLAARRIEPAGSNDASPEG